METQLLPAFVNLGVTGLILWWITQKLVPDQLDAFERRSDRLQELFKSEMEKERLTHERTIEKVVLAAQDRDKIWMVMMRDVLAGGMPRE